MFPPIFEATCYRGTEPWVAAEIGRTKKMRVIKTTAGAVLFSYGHNGRPPGPERLRNLKLPLAVYQVISLDIPRPKALLGDQLFRHLNGTIRQIMADFGPDRFKTLGLQAAGRESAVMQRIHQALSRSLGLQPVSDQGDVSIRIRRSIMTSSGWDVLIRLGSRPLSVREWRVFDFPGAINGPLAALINELAGLTASDRLLNVACGSGTLLIERRHPPQIAIGGDIDSTVLFQGRQNLQAAGVQAGLVQLSGSRLPFQDGSFEVVTADLPWGQLVGDHRENRELYPQVAAEAQRVLVQGGRLAVITHEIQRYQEAIGRCPDMEKIQDVRVQMGNVAPRIIVHARSFRN